MTKKRNKRFISNLRFPLPVCPECRAMVSYTFQKDREGTVFECHHCLCKFEIFEDDTFIVKRNGFNRSVCYDDFFYRGDNL
jgi:hypothetical protein